MVDCFIVVGNVVGCGVWVIGFVDFVGFVYFVGCVGSDFGCFWGFVGFVVVFDLLVEFGYFWYFGGWDYLLVCWVY